MLTKIGGHLHDVSTIKSMVDGSVESLKKRETISKSLTPLLKDLVLKNRSNINTLFIYDLDNRDTSKLSPMSSSWELRDFVGEVESKGKRLIFEKEYPKLSKFIVFLKTASWVAIVAPTAIACAVGLGILVVTSTAPIGATALTVAGFSLCALMIIALAGSPMGVTYAALESMHPGRAEMGAIAYGFVGGFIPIYFHMKREKEVDRLLSEADVNLKEFTESYNKISEEVRTNYPSNKIDIMNKLDEYTNEIKVGKMENLDNFSRLARVLESMNKLHDFFLVEPECLLFQPVKPREG